MVRMHVHESLKVIGKVVSVSNRSARIYHLRAHSNTVAKALNAQPFHYFEQHKLDVH